MIGAIFYPTSGVPCYLEEIFLELPAEKNIQNPSSVWDNPSINLRYCANKIQSQDRFNFFHYRISILSGRSAEKLLIHSKKDFFMF